MSQFGGGIQSSAKSSQWFERQSNNDGMIGRGSALTVWLVRRRSDHSGFSLTFG